MNVQTYSGGYDFGVRIHKDSICNTYEDHEMKNEKTKVYIYTRVSTAMQIDGYSLDAQKSRMRAFAEFNDYKIVGEYEDAGKSGKSVEGRIQFNQMMEDI